ncbi:hypothetical protein L1049_014647 [Liquidambar formosana]|uniref:DUF4283 domain-containing protein n=1 Tax=Liquidambar formosana TaxID=63359 RepID=A0AAP0RW83_LIQFO
MDAHSVELSQLISQTANLSCFDEIEDLVPATGLLDEVMGLLLVGKIVAEKGFNKQLVISILSKAWNQLESLNVTFLAQNTFLFGFSKVEDRNKILSSGPWNVKGFLIVVKEWSLGLVLEEISFSLSPFSVQIHGLPLDLKTVHNASKIGGRFGGFIEVDDRWENQLALNNFLRIRVNIDILKPLKTGFLFKRHALPAIWFSLSMKDSQIFVTDVVV